MKTEQRFQEASEAQLKESEDHSKYLRAANSTQVTFLQVSQMYREYADQREGTMRHL